MSGMTGGNESRRVKLTYDDVVHFPDDGMRHELIDGEHFVTPSPNTSHQRISRRLALAIGQWLQAHPIGEVFFAPFDVVFTKFDVVDPDLLYISKSRAREMLTDTHGLGADLVVEIGSPGTRRRDETLKLQLYQRAAVIEYWFVDPEHEIVRVYARAGNRFEAPQALKADRGDVLTTALLPGFRLRTGKIFTD
jgi:Uma2 family endonuclease